MEGRVGERTLADRLGGGDPVEMGNAAASGRDWWSSPDPGPRAVLLRDEVMGQFTGQLRSSPCRAAAVLQRLITSLLLDLLAAGWAVAVSVAASRRR